MSNMDVAVASFWQKARHWKMGDKAKLELLCEGEKLHIQLSAVLGHLDHPHFPPLPSPNSEEDAVNPVKPISDNENSKENHSEQEEEHVHNSSTEILLKCNQCDLIFKNNKGLKIQGGKAHKVVVQQTSEKERSNSFPKELSLSLTPINSKRDEEEVVETPEQVKATDLDQNSSFNCE